MKKKITDELFPGILLEYGPDCTYVGYQLQEHGLIILNSHFTRDLDEDTYCVSHLWEEGYLSKKAAKELYRNATKKIKSILRSEKRRIEERHANH